LSFRLLLTSDRRREQFRLLALESELLAGLLDRLRGDRTTLVEALDDRPLERGEQLVRTNLVERLLAELDAAHLAAAALDRPKDFALGHVISSPSEASAPHQSFKLGRGHGLVKRTVLRSPAVANPRARRQPEIAATCFPSVAVRIELGFLGCQHGLV